MSTNFIEITETQYGLLVRDAKVKSIFIAEIDGNTIKNLDDYLAAVWKAFNFPQTGHVNFYAYLDWIRDLDWIDANMFALVIRNFDNLLKQSQKDREIIVNSLDKTVIPWWQSEIKQYQVEGNPKPFNVYLIVNIQWG
jgi:hypothetical protein